MKYCSVHSPKKNMCRNNLFACRCACPQGHSCRRMTVEKLDIRLNSFIDFKDVLSELAAHAETEMIISTSGPLQGGRDD